LVHHIAVKLEIILDKEADITHQAFADQIEARLGSGEGDNAKGPDMKVWNKGRNLGDVRTICDVNPVDAHCGDRLIGNWQNSAIRP
jgi:hypothetical protein